jgi:hypothetical protein
MNRGLRRKFDRYAEKHGIPKAINKYLVGEDKQKALKVMLEMKAKLAVPTSPLLHHEQNQKKT